MQTEPDCVTVEVIPLGLASVEPQIPEPIAWAGAAVMTLNPLAISRSARSPNPIFLDIKNRVRGVGMMPSLGEETLATFSPAYNLY
jgi:hypothetical protein